MAFPERFLSRKNFCLECRGRSLTAGRRSGNFGSGPWGAPALRFCSLNWGCWDSAFQSSLHKEKWQHFVNPVGKFLEFLQERLSAGLVPAMLTVYEAAVLASHVHTDGSKLFHHTPDQTTLPICFLQPASGHTSSLFPSATWISGARKASPIMSSPGF